MRKRKNAELRKPEILEHFYQVIIQEGIEGASMAKIAHSMNIHTSLIFHYFKNKENILLELAEYIQQKYDPPYVREQINTIKDPERRFDVFFDTMFSEADVKTVNPRVFYAFYYLSYRNPKIRERFVHMFTKHRDWIIQELEIFLREGIIKKIDLEMAADFIVSIFEGLSFHSEFLAGDKPFDIFGQFAKKLTKDFLKA
ncbi:MAG: TetR/AcrR family transcriptional regulator [Cyclobacteriaceae bacterium]|nr:TetR/AcrR family transcriptional regulator [Cyclobacteriaceae bacterium]